MRLRRRWWHALLLSQLLLQLAMASCAKQPLAAPEPGLERMIEQPKVLPFEPDPRSGEATASSLLAPPAGVVARDQLAEEAPPRLDRAGVEHGRERFEILCAACHGLLGDGQSPVARRMRFVHPRDLLSPAQRAARLPRLVQVISQGYGLMPSMAGQLTPGERWQVAAYLKALQLSRGVQLAALPPQLRARASRELP